MDNDFNNMPTKHSTPHPSPSPLPNNDMTFDTNFDPSLDFNQVYPIPGQRQKNVDDTDNFHDDDGDNNGEGDTNLTPEQREKRRRKIERRQKAYEWTEKARLDAQQALRPQDINELKLKVFLSFFFHVQFNLIIA
jgi:hypothetical protein